MTTYWFGCDATMCTGSRQSIFEFNLYAGRNGHFVIPNTVKGRFRHPHEVVRDLVHSVGEKYTLTNQDIVIIFTWGGPECKSLMRAVKGFNETFTCDIYLIDLQCVEGVPYGKLKYVHKDIYGYDKVFEDLTKDMYDAKRIYQLADKLLNPETIGSVSGYPPLIEKDVFGNFRAI